MINTCAKIISLFGLLLPLCAVAQDSDVKADVAISIQQDQETWTGQQVTVNLDLKTTGFSFSNSQFNLPEVNAAFLMQTDTTTIKFSENINGVTWQVIRYPLALYPQKAGQLVIPAIDIRFITSAGYGSTETAFEFRTEPLQLTVKSPPGIKEGDLVVTTSSFDLKHNWQPQSAEAQTGDAFTLTVTRRAKDISGMLLPPLPVFETEGLAAYPQAAEVSDKTNRGDLTGERTDAIIWVVEKPGKYDIPGIRFQWWDPINHELKQQIIPGLSLNILPAPLDITKTGTHTLPVQASNKLLWLLPIVLIVFILWHRFGRKAPGQPVESEKSTFAALQAACKHNNIGQTHSALHAWLVWSAPVASPNSRPVTLDEFARIHADAQLSNEFQQLQEALVASDSNWQGNKLFSVLQDVRRKIHKQQTAQSKAQLAPLNP